MEAVWERCMRGRARGKRRRRRDVKNGGCRGERFKSNEDEKAA